MKYPKQPALACPIGNIGVGARPMVAFSGLYESHKPPPSGDVRGIIQPSKRSAKWVHAPLSLCWLSPWRPPGRYGAISCPIVASSGFQWSPGHAALVDALCIALAHRHGHRNRLNIEVSGNKLISTLIYGIMAESEWTCARPPTPEFIKSTPLEGWAAPPPWWWCLVGDLCFLCGLWLVTRQADTSYLRFRGVIKWATQACTIPPMLNMVMPNIVQTMYTHPPHRSL
jgi:hypothetical protein